MYHNKTFRSVGNTASGKVSGDTVFHYRQAGTRVWADYAGGAIRQGFLIATLQPDNSLDGRCQPLNQAGERLTGRCHSTPETRPDGRLRLHERWQWTSGDGSAGESVVDELTA